MVSAYMLRFSLSVGFLLVFLLVVLGFFPLNSSSWLVGAVPLQDKCWSSISICKCSIAESQTPETCALRPWVQGLTGTLFSRCLDSFEEEIHECSLVWVIWRTLSLLMHTSWENLFGISVSVPKLWEN